MPARCPICDTWLLALNNRTTRRCAYRRDIPLLGKLFALTNVAPRSRRIRLGASRKLRRPRRDATIRVRAFLLNLALCAQRETSVPLGAQESAKRRVALCDARALLFSIKFFKIFSSSSVFTSLAYANSGCSREHPRAVLSLSSSTFFYSPRARSAASV